LGLSCKPIPDPISQQFSGQIIQLPQTFDTWQLNLDFTASQIATEFETEFEAQRRHAAGASLIPGTQNILATESETLAAYDCDYFFESENPNMMFKIDNHIVFPNAISTGILRTNSIRRAIAFVELVFEVNDRLGTQPPTRTPA